MPRSRLAKSVIALLSLFLVLHSLAALSYPGGTWLDNTKEGYSFFGNYLCDILAEKGINGQDNPGYWLARGSFAAIILSLFFFWLLLNRMLKPISIKASNFQLICSIIAAAGFVAVLVIDVEDKLLSAHSIAVLLTIFSGLSATMLPLLMFLKTKELSKLGQHGFALIFPCLLTVVIYLAYQFGVLPDDRLIPAAQKFCILCVSGLLVLAAYSSNKFLPHKKQNNVQGSATVQEFA